MLRNSILYRRLWYLKKRGAVRIHIYFRLIFVVFLLILSAYYINKMMLPVLLHTAEIKVKAVVDSAIQEVIDEIFTDNLKHENYLKINRDDTGRIKAVETDVVRLNRLSAEVSARLFAKLSASGREKIPIPFGVLFGNSIFAGIGPNLYISFVPAGNVRTEFKSEFAREHGNQTRHSIYLQINAEISIQTPLTSKKVSTACILPLAETILVGI